MTEAQEKAKKELFEHIETNGKLELKTIENRKRALQWFNVISGKNETNYNCSIVINMINHCLTDFYNKNKEK